MAGAPTRRTSADPLLARARAGDEHAFATAVDPYRGELHAHCYRMLGSVHDAEDALQEALLRAWRGLAKFEGRSSLRSWLYTIATNTCLDLIARRPKRVLPIDYGPATDPHDGPGEPIVESVWIEPYPDERLTIDDGLAGPDARYEQRESIELAFVAALQHLPPNQRAVLILREVLGFSAAEVAGTLETTVASVNSALQRARATLEERDIEATDAVAPMDPTQREFLERYIDAFQRYDVDALTAILREDATQSMPPYDMWLSGREHVLKWWFGPGIGCRGSRVIPVETANGSIAFGQYKPSESGSGHDPWALQVLEIADGKIVDITFFLSTERLFPLWGLPPRLDD